MKIVVCDDNTKDLVQLENLLLNYDKNYLDSRFEIEKYSDAALLSKKIKTNDLADIYILDIIMSKISGIDLGDEIRKRDTRPAIIYVTTSDEFALDAYDIHAVRYLLKPLDKETFFEALDYALSSQDGKKGAPFLIKTKNGLMSVPHEQIEYIENSSRKLQVHLTKNEVITSIFIRKSFEEEIKDLEMDRNFLHVHKSFLINMKHVKRINRYEITMDSGAIIPVSRKSTLDVKKEYLAFVSQQYR